MTPREGGLKGLTRCTADSECLAGRCSEGMCLRICADAFHCPVGFACAELELPGGLGVHRCTGVGLDGTPDPALTICRGERDCPADRLCRFYDLGGDVECQTLAGPANDRATPVCAPRPPAAVLELREYCSNGSQCAAGICTALCERDGDYATVCGYCHCAQPCQDNTDCPPLTNCTSFIFRLTGDGEAARFCAASDPACVDEVDCCPELDAEGLCLGGWSPVRQHCSLSEIGGRPAQLCMDLDGKLPGEPCTGAQECTTRLCEPRLSDGLLFCTGPCSTGADRCSAIAAGLSCSAPVNATVPGLTVCR